MSNLKSKFLLVVMIVAVMFVGAFALTLSAEQAEAQTACTITTTLRVGSSGTQVKCLQMGLGITADGAFGPKDQSCCYGLAGKQRTCSGRNLRS
jgi:hypothetical protein